MSTFENRLDLLGRLVAGYVANLFAKHASSTLLYHNLAHTRLVATRALEIASFYSLGATERFVLLAAAWFHDTGQLFCGPVGHEQMSVAIMEDFLAPQELAKEKIRDISGCIMATRIPHSPENLLHEIICDADTYNLGTKEFLTTDPMLKEELQLRGLVVEPGWDEATLDFLTWHRFFTTYCRERLEAGKQRNIDILRSRIEGK